MNECVCVNPDKEEYINFGDIKKNCMEDSAACNTLVYFLGTEWAGDRIAFIFEEQGESSLFPNEDCAYDYVIANFAERCILNRTPRYEFVANISLKEYYFKAAIPQGDNGVFTNPLPFILSEKKNLDLIGWQFTASEEAQMGRWYSGNLIATNNAIACSGYTLFESPYRHETQFSKTFAGKNIAVTGCISGFTRGGIEDFIRQHGGNPQNTVTKKTDFLVMGYNPGSKKINDASKLGTKIIREEDFFEMVKED